jgi:predicted amidohydrolase
MKLKIGVVQFERKKSFKTNLKRFEFFVKKLASLGADIIVFPENFLSSSVEGRDFIHSGRKFEKLFSEIAKRYSVDLVAGSVIEKSWFGKKYNTCYYIDSSGKVLGKYRKVHLWHPEKRTISPGNKTEVIKTRFGNIGLIICWDLIFPEIFREMTKKNVEIVFCPSHWCYKDSGKGLEYDKNAEIKNVDATCVERVFEEEIILVYCNSAGKIKLTKGYDSSIGHSQISVPFKGVIKKLNHNHESFFIKQVDTSILKQAEKSYKIKEDLK